MLKPLLLFSSLFISLSISGQNISAFLTSSQDIYFSGDTIFCTLSQLSTSKDTSSKYLILFDGTGKVIEQFYLRPTNETKKVFFEPPSEIKSGWLYIQAFSSKGELISNTLRIFIWGSNNDAFNYKHHNGQISIYTEGASPLIYGLSGILRIKMNNYDAKFEELSIVLKTESGIATSRSAFNQDGFAKLNITPKINEKYFLELRDANSIISTKNLTDSIFSTSGISLKLNYITHNTVNILIESHKKSFLTAKIKHIGTNKFLETLPLGTANNFSLDLKKYPDGLLSVSIFNQKNDRLFERLVYNKKARFKEINASIINSPQIIKRGDSITLRLNLSKDDYSKLDIESLVITIEDSTQNLFSGLHSNTIQEAKLYSLRYFYTELLDKVNSNTRSARSLDNYFAINQIFGVNHNTNKKIDRSKEEGIILQGKLTDSTNQSLPYTSVILTVPTIKNSFRWTTTDSQGYFNFSGLKFNGKRDIFLVPIFNDPLQSYVIKLNFAGSEKYVRNFETYVSNRTWQTINKSLELTSLIRRYYNEQTQSERIGSALNKEEVKSIFDNVDYDINLDEYELPQQMRKLINPIIPGVNVRKSKLRIFSTELHRQYNKQPLVFIDGVLYSNIDSLLSIDPARFKRVQVISSFKNLRLFGSLGNSGVIAFYTRDGYDTNDNYSYSLILNGYKDFEIPNKHSAMPPNEETPYIKSSYIYNVYSLKEQPSDLSVGFIAPDKTTTLVVKVLLIHQHSVSTITKSLNIEK